MMRRSRVKPIVTATAITGLIATALIAIFLGARVVEAVSTEARSVASLNELPEVPEGIEGVAEWLPDLWARERVMEPATRVSIESAYLRAWTSLNAYQTTGSTSVVTDSFSGVLRDRVRNITPDLSTSTVSIRHNLELTFYALDGATVALRDVGAQFVRTTLSGDAPLVVLSQESFDVVMVLEDGYWRVRQLVRAHSEAPVVISVDSTGAARIFGGSNLPSKNVEDYTATNYRVDAGSSSTDRVSDLTLIKSLGFSAVRLSIDESSLSSMTATTVVPELWADVMKDVERVGLSAIVVVSLAAPVSIDDWPREYVIATTVISTIAGNNALLMWDLVNEPDVDLSSDQVPQAIGYVYQLREFIDSVDPRTPVTVTWNSSERAADPTLASMVDAVSLHLDVGEDPAAALRAVQTGERDVTLVIDTANTQPGWSPTLVSEGRQAAIASARLLDLQSVGVKRWTMGQLRDAPGDSRGLVDDTGSVRAAGTLFGVGDDLVRDPPPIWDDALRSPFWRTTLAVVSLIVIVAALSWMRRTRRRARDQTLLGRP